jgi:hypothetical protein
MVKGKAYDGKWVISSKYPGNRTPHVSAIFNF